MVKQIAHIGYPKTGTYWFRNNLYFRLQKYEIIQNSTIQQAIITVNALKFSAEEAQEMLKNYLGKDIIIDFHGFIGTTHAFGASGYLTKEHCSRLKDVFGDIHIVLMLRNQIDLIDSHYKQHIIEGGTYSTNKYLNFRSNFSFINALMLFDKDHFDFYTQVKFQQKLFGKDNVHVYFFEEFSENPELFCKKMFDDLGITEFPDNVDYSISNGSLPMSYYRILRFLNRFSKYYVVNKDYYFTVPLLFNLTRKRSMRNWLFKKSTYKKRYAFSEKQRGYIADLYRESNNKMIDELGFNEVKKYKYPL
jgi:hypothetical protein